MMMTAMKAPVADWLATVARAQASCTWTGDCAQALAHRASEQAIKRCFMGNPNQKGETRHGPERDRCRTRTIQTPVGGARAGAWALAGASRPRWACAEIGLPYSTRLISALERPKAYYTEQPWGQVPLLEDGDLSIFESGAILLHLGEKDARLLPRDPQRRMETISWLFAAYNSIEPWIFEIANTFIANSHVARPDSWYPHPVHGADHAEPSTSH